MAQDNIPREPGGPNSPEDPPPETHRSDGSDREEFPTGLIASVSDSIAKFQLLTEESLWLELAKAKASESRTLEARIALKHAYTKLADYYAGAGGNESAVRFLKNAIAEDDDPTLRRELAKREGFVAGNDFINSYNHLFSKSGDAFDLQLTLEFCFFLEARNLHQAALNVLETELRKRLRHSAPPSRDESETISRFLHLLKAQISVEQHLKIEDYRQIINASFPEEIVRSVENSQAQVDESIAGVELEEFEKDYGLVDEIRKYAQQLAFFTEHYTVAVLIAGITLTLFLLTMFRVPANVIEAVGSTATVFLMSFLLFEFVRSLRLKGIPRLRAHTKITQNAIFSSTAIVLLNFVGTRVLRVDQSFVSPIVARLTSFVLVFSLLWRAHLSMVAIRNSLRKMRSDLLRAIERRTFRRHLADLVAGTSKWTLFGGWAFFWYMTIHAAPLRAVIYLIQTLFLAVCWRWGHLEALAEKQRLRDSLMFIAGVCLSIVALLSFADKVPPLHIAVALSMDTLIVLSMGVTFALQISAINRTWIAVCATVFVLLDFSPLLERIGAFSVGGLERVNGPLVVLTTRIVEIAVVFTITLVAVRARAKANTTFVHEEFYMDAKYKITGGQQGAVGDHAVATNFTQLWQSHAAEVDLVSLAGELSSFRGELEGHATVPNHSDAIREVLGAEEAARKGEGGAVLEHMKRAGTWIWEVGTKVGIGVATAQIKALLGL